MIFLVDNSFNTNKHRINPITGKWTGWCDNKQAAKKATFNCTEAPRTLDQFFKDKRTYNQTILEVEIDNRTISFQEFTKLYPEYFV